MTKPLGNLLHAVNLIMAVPTIAVARTNLSSSIALHVLFGFVAGKVFNYLRSVRHLTRTTKPQSKLLHSMKIISH